MIQLHSQITHLVAEIGLRADLDLCRPFPLHLSPPVSAGSITGDVNKVEFDVSTAAGLGVRREVKSFQEETIVRTGTDGGNMGNSVCLSVSRTRPRASEAGL